MKQLTIEQARQRSSVGLSTEGFQIVQRSLENRLIDALRQNTVFVTHSRFELLINFESDNSAVVYSEKDRNRYQVAFEMDENDAPRVTKITPLGPLEPSQEVIREQVVQKMAIGLPVSQKEIDTLEALNARDREEADRKLQLEQLAHRRVLGFISEAQFFQERDRLLVEHHRARSGKKPLFDADEDSASKRGKLWEAQRAGKIGLDECLTKCAEIRLASEHGRGRQLLVEQNIAPACECGDLSECRVQLDEAIRTGLLSESAADDMWNARLAMD